MRRMLRQAAHRATSTSLRLVDVALCRALAQRMTTPEHRPAPAVRIVHRTTADLGAPNLAHLDAAGVLAELRRLGWGEPKGRP